MELKLEVSIMYRGTAVRTYWLLDTDVNEDQALEMGKRIAEGINEVRPKLKRHEELTLSICDCFWRDLPEEEKLIHNSHSSGCAIWDDLSNEEI